VPLQDLNEMAVALGRKIKDLEFVEAEFLALQQVWIPARI
jgi:hypothetical protein